MVTNDKKHFWRNIEPLWHEDTLIYELRVRVFCYEAMEKAKDEDTK